MSTIPVTALYGSLLALFYLGLSMNVSRARMGAQIYNEQTDKVPEPLHRARRAHANASEYIPLGVALLLMLELSGGSSLWLHIIGGTLLLGRVLHAAGLMRDFHAVQIPGILLTWGPMLVTAVYVLVLRFR